MHTHMHICKLVFQKSNKITNTSHEKLPFDSLVRVQKTLQTIQAFVLVFGCFQEINSKFFLLKISCSMNTGLGGYKLDLTRRPPSWGLSFIVPEGAMQTTKEEMRPIILLSCKVYEHKNNQHDKISLKVQWGTHILVLLTNSRLIGF